MDSDTPKATERSEGGSDKRKGNHRKKVLTEIVMVRITEGDRVAFQLAADENDWSVSQAIRVLARRGLGITPAPHRVDLTHQPAVRELERESFEGGA
jgi:hypothetical protein